MRPNYASMQTGDVPENSDDQTSAAEAEQGPELSNGQKAKALLLGLVAGNLMGRSPFVGFIVARHVWEKEKKKNREKQKTQQNTDTKKIEIERQKMAQRRMSAGPS
ncbi:MAG: hypothetical protein PHW76_09595 [Alphaproteobacteria bacterium]|nr:hypothetical protein [Alphaproteobacteria bacterium]